MKAVEQNSTSNAAIQRKSAASFFGNTSEQEQPFFAAKGTGNSDSFFSPATPHSKNPTIQAKLTVGAPNDKYEQEADATADKVVQRLGQSETVQRTSALSVSTVSAATTGVEEDKLQKKEEEKQPEEVPELQKSPVSAVGEEEGLQMKCADCEEEDKKHVQRKENGETTASPSIESRLSASKGGGSPLPNETRGQMESAMGADFSGVRIHTGGEAVQMSQDLNAHAFTHGPDVYFNSGKYNPSNTEGSRLLAHELTHTVQQGAAVKRKPIDINPAVHAMHITSIQREKAEYDLLQRNIFGDAWRATTNLVGNLNPRTALNNAAMNIPGFRLITVIIGHNPIADTAVPRTAENLIGGFLALIPGGNLLFQKLQETHAITQMLTWLEQEIATLNITLASITGLIRQLLDNLTSIAADLLRGSFATVHRILDPPINRIMTFLGRIGTKVKEFIFRGALQLVGAPVEMVMGILNRAGNVIQAIFNDPIAFGRNLIQSIVGGIRQFATNAGQHLMNGLIGWLTGALAGAGLQLPREWSLSGIFSLVAQLLNMTYQAIRVKAVRILGEPTVARLEQVFEFIKDLITRGPIALWEHISEFLGNLQEMVMGGIREFVMSRMIQQGVARLVSMFNPAGALIQAVMAIYNTIQFFMERASQLATFAGAVFQSISQIASGNLGAAMTWIENAMARSIPVILGFIGRLLGLGNISAHIRRIIERVRRPIDTAVDRVIDWVVAQARRLVSGVRGGGQEAQSPERAAALSGGLATLTQKENAYATGDSITRENAEKTARETHQAHPSVFQHITVIEKDGNWDYDYVQKSKKQAGGGATAFNITSHSRQPSPRSPYQSHHIIQSEWAAQNYETYSRGAAPAILLEQTQHSIITTRQNQRRDERVLQGKEKWASTLPLEKRYTRSDLQAAGVPSDKIQEAMNAANTYFNSL